MNKLLLIILLFISTLYANIGTVMAVKGNAEVQRMDALVKVTNGMELLKSDEIVTQKRSRVQVVLNDSTTITIGPNSSFTFEDFSFDGTDKSEIAMKANRGFFRSVTGKIGKVAPERFKVKTASATIGIRGTDFSGDISAELEVLKCYSGAIVVEFEGGLQDIEAGMMMEISSQKIEIKSIATSKDKATPQTMKKEKQKESKEKKIENKVVQNVDVKVIVPMVIEQLMDREINNVDAVVEKVEEIVSITLDRVAEQEILVDDIVDIIDDVIDDITDDVIVDIPDETIVEPFELTPTSEDRPVVY